MRYFGRDNKYRRLLRLQRRFPRFWRGRIEAAVYQIRYPSLTPNWGKDGPPGLTRAGGGAYWWSDEPSGSHSGP